MEHDIHELLVATLDEACALTGSAIGFYHFLEADQKTLSLQDWSTQTTQSYCRAIGQGLHYDLDRAGVWAECIREGRTLIHNDYPLLTIRQGLPEGHAEVLREAVVPIFQKGLIVAIIGIANKPTLYTDKHVEMVSTLADLAWDIIERKCAEERIQSSEAQLRSILDTINEGVGLWDAHGMLRYVNPGAERLFGRLIREVIPTRYDNTKWKFMHE